MVVFEKRSLSASMNVKIIGTAEEVVVLGHGYGGDHTIWDKIVPSLAEKYRVVVFDWKFSGAARTHGKELQEQEDQEEEEEEEEAFDPIKYSTYDAFAADLVDLMDEMELASSSPVFVGHSMSGMIGCIASIKRPHLFKKLILIGASPRYLNSEEEDYVGGMEREEVDKLLADIETDFHKWASAFAPAAVGGGRNDDINVEKFEKSLKSMGAEAALSLAKTIFLGDWRHILKEVTTPCTIIQTTHDIVVPNSVGYYMLHNMLQLQLIGNGKSKLVHLENIQTHGHFPQLTAPHQLLHVLARALATLP
ncbi:hypothetical protein Dimus_034439 [Dionaea muscipula]